jgi:hypothetical protein
MSLKQSDLYRFERLMSKLMRSSAIAPMVHFIPNGGSIKLLASTDNAMLTMHAPRDGFLDPFSMQWSDFKTIAVKKNNDVEFDLEKNAVVVRCEGISQRFLTGKNVKDLPYQPSQTSTFPKDRLLNALTNASRCVDKDSIKNAITGICLRGSPSQIVSTTGCQLLVQDGYDFCETGDMVIPVCKIFGSKELKGIDDDEVSVGLINGYVYFGIGAAEIYLKTLDGVFPKVSQLLEPADGTTYLNLHPTDVQFILDRIEKLPGVKDNESPLYFHINKAIRVQSHDIAHKTGIALELSHSRFTGEPVDVAVNRHFLKNALQFGCWSMGIDPTGNKAIIFKGDDKTFVCMPLTGTEPEAEHIDVVTVPTHAVASAVPKTTATTPAPVKRRRRTVKRDASVKRDAVQPTGKMALLVTAEQIRNDLRNSLIQVNSLIREVKAQRQKDRLLQNTMDNLRKLSL